MLERFKSFIERKNLFGPVTPVLLAVSGGVDSAVMSRLFANAGFRFGIAHINFKLRSQESDDDAHFVRVFAEQLKVPFFNTSFETSSYAESKKISIQMAARELRYEWLEKVRKENGFHFIATAHHKNDSVETVLLNMIRGAGIKGLAGIPVKNNHIIRPMLAFFREEIELFAKENNMEFRTDTSNLKPDYERNKIRLELLPTIEKYYPGFSKTISENIERWEAGAFFYSMKISELLKRMIASKDGVQKIQSARIRHEEFAESLLFEWLKPNGFNPDQIRQVFHSLESTEGKAFHSISHRLIKDRSNLILSEKSETILSEQLIEETSREIMLPHLRLLIEKKPADGFQIPLDSTVHCLNAALCEFPLIVRPWKKGDYFYPLGMKKKKKKISDYLIDRKIPLHEKSGIYVIESGNHIVCVVGERIDERFKISTSTKEILVIKSIAH